ncbi:hypothetical protein Tco_1132873 [Tanacetum coccineum]|uniref:Uncharacterized protein n=1 Tax=Tanacetum coccineum TaxID=301880 RepID=A0ABQ5JD58_9ASTR
MPSISWQLFKKIVHPMIGSDDIHNGDHIFYDTLTLKEMFTSRDGESMESYYSWFYKLMNKLTRNNLQVTTIASENGSISSTIQPEWSIPSSSTRHKGKEIAKPVTPQFELVSDEDSDPEQAQRDKEMQKNLALLASIQEVYKPTNIPSKTSSNSMEQD